MVMEEQISSAIVRSFFKKLESHLAVDVAVVGASKSPFTKASSRPAAAFGAAAC